MKNERYETDVREYLAGAGRAVDRGDAVSAANEAAQAISLCFSWFRQQTDGKPQEYRCGWDSVANELSKLPPSLLREVARIAKDRG